MYQVSNEINELIRSSSRRFSAKLVIGDKEISNIKSIKLSRNTIAGDSVSIGGTTSATATVIISKTEIEKNSEADIYTIIKDCSIPMAKMTVIDAVTVGDLTTLTLYDVMATKMERQYVSKLSYPAKDADVLDEICDSVGITFVDNLENNKMIDKAPEGYTKREIIGFIAALHAKNAVINRAGNLEFKWFEETYEPDSEYFDEPSINSNAITVKSIQSVGTDNKKIQAGSGTTQIQISNPFATTTHLSEILEKVNGFTYTPINISMRLGDPLMDPWDIITYKGYKIPCMNLELEYDGGIKLNIKSLGKEKSEDNYDNKGPIAKQMERYYGELVLMKEAMIDKLDVEELSAEVAKLGYATIAELVALDVKVKGKLSTDELEAEVAKLGYVTINEFVAAQGRISVLETTALTSSSAVIKDLQVGVTKTNTLIFGSATGNTIQTEFSNSVIAQLGDAQIESAMIKEISASKITGLDLNTTNLAIHSEDGLSQWKDNTIVMHDGVLATPRIQIGKDGSGDYNMYIWNAQGKLMFDALGLTEEGISRPIIRDDMVANNADINVGKLNIESLFNEINNNTVYTLKSSKIYLDDEKQTLDVSFKVMSSNVDNLQSIQSSQATDISVIQGKISSKIWQQDITTAVDNLEIGGRNLIINSSKYRKDSPYTRTSAAKDGIFVADMYMPCKNGETYTFQCCTDGIWGRHVTNGTATGWTHMYILLQTEGQSGVAYSRVFSLDKDQSLGLTGKQTWTYTVPENDGNIYTQITFRFDIHSDGVTSHTVNWWDLKAERGTKATDWTPAPEDIDNDITTLNTQYSSMEQTIDSISATVASHTTQIAQKASTSVVTNISSDLTTVKADLEGFKTTVSNTYTTKTDFNNLEIGGRNYIYYGKGNVKKGFFTNFDTVTDEYGEVTLTSQNTYASKLLNGGFIISTRDYEVGAKIVFSYDIMYTQWCPKETSIGELWMGQRYSRQTITGGDTTGAWTGVTQHNLPRVGQNGCELNKWYHVEVVKVIPAQAAEGIGTAECIQFYNSNADVKATIKFRMKNVKIEYGTKATDWTPALEDIDNSIADVDAKFASYSTSSEVISAIEQKANQITQTVSSTYATKVEFNNLEIGGRNLISGTSTDEHTFAYPETDFIDRIKYQTIDVPNKDNYVLSFDAKSTVNGDKIMCYFYNPNTTLTSESSTGDKFTYGDGGCVVKLSDSWTRHWVKYTQDGAATTEKKHIIVGRLISGNGSGEVSIRSVKFEEGNKPTDWTPAPEDIDNSIADIDAKFMEYSTTAEMTAAINIKANEITQEVSNTYATKVDFNNLEIGGRNLVTGTSSEYKSVTIGQYYTSIAVLNIAELCEKYALKNGDILTYSVYLKSNSGKTIAARWQKYNSESDRQGSVSSQRIINGEGISTVQVVIDTSYTNLQLAITNVSTSIKDSTTEYFKFVKLEKGTKATDWTPSPEDIDVELKSTKTLATQTSEMMDWLVESGTSATNFTLTDRMAQLTAQKIKLKGYLEVDGNMLVDGVITSKKIATDAIKSRNYVANVSGSYLNLEDGAFSSKYLSWDKYGRFIAKEGEIGKWAIQPDGGLMAETNTGTKPGTLNRLYLQPFNNTDYEDTWVISSQYWGIDSNGDLADEGEAYWCITGGGDFYTSGYVQTSMLYADMATIYGKTEIYGNGLELYYSTPYIDFHYNANTTDHTARIIENSSGALTVYNSISNASDERLKQDICELDKRYLNVLNSLKPVSYRFIKGSDNLNIGFVAQPVEETLINCGINDLPIVSKSNDGIYALDYNQITALNTLGHLDHEKRIQQLENDLAIANAIIQSLLIQSSV